MHTDLAVYVSEDIFLHSYLPTMRTKLLLYFFIKLPPPAISNLDGSTLSQPHPQPLQPSTLRVSAPHCYCCWRSGGEIPVVVPISQIRKLRLRDVILYLPKVTGSLCFLFT